MSSFPLKMRKVCGQGCKRKHESVIQLTLSTNPLGKYYNRTHALGLFAGPIFVVILIVDIAFFALLEWLIPRNEIDYVSEECDWSQATFERYAKVGHEQMSEKHFLTLIHRTYR